MKIRIKDTNIIINEDLSLKPAEDIAANPTGEKPQSSLNLCKLVSKRRYLLERKRESLPVKISVPGDFNNFVSIPKAPIDINNLMKSAETNKANKTRDFEKWGMVNPVDTYNAAEDCCEKAFSSFFDNKVKLTTDKSEIKDNKTNLSPKTNESIEYNDYYALNEVGMTGAAVGSAVGSAIGVAGANVLTFLGSAGAAFTTTIAPVAIPTIIGASLIGKAAGANVDINNGAKSDNSKALIDETKNMLDPKEIASMPMQYGNVVDALDNYIETTIQSVRELVSGMSAEMESEYNTEIADFIYDFMEVESKKAEKFLLENKKAVEKQKELERQKTENRLKNKVSNLGNVNTNTFLGKLYAILIKSKADEKVLTKANTIIKYYQDHENDQDELDNALKGGYNEILKTYQKLKEESKSLIVDSLNINYNNILNEETNSDNLEKPVINMREVYGTLSKELARKFAKVFAKYDGKKMGNYEETKQNMQLIIDEADKTIKDRIELITKSQVQNLGGQNDSGLTKAAIQFLAGHPLEKNNLLEIWSRHLADLKMRMNSRLKTMTDANNPTRTIGWTKNFCLTSIPYILARVLTYRYTYSILTNSGIYSYDTAQVELEAKAYDDPSTGIAERYEAAPRNRILWLLENFSKDYTFNNESCLVISDNGEYSLNDNYFSYASFLFKNLNRSRITNKSIFKDAVALANIGNDDKVQGLETLIGFINAKLNQDELISDDEKIFEKVVNKFKISADLANLKPLIYNTYNTITGQEIKNELVNKLNGENGEANAEIISNSLYIISNNWEKIKDTVIKNKDKIDSLIKTNVQNDKSNKTDDNIRKQIHELFDYLDFPNLPENPDPKFAIELKKAFGLEENNLNTDYYTYVLSWFTNAGNIKNIEQAYTIDGIKETCEITPILLKLAISCLLVDTNQKDKLEKVDTAKIDKLIKEIKDIPCAKLAAYNALTTIDTTNNQTFEECKKILIYLQNEYIKSTIEEYNKISNGTAAKAESNKSKYVLDLLGDTNNLSNIITKIGEKQYENYDSNSLIADISAYTVKADSEIKEEFNKISDNDKLIICNNLLTAIKNSKDTNEYKLIVKSIDDAIKIADE